jgi:hypothetical protein
VGNFQLKVGALFQEHVRDRLCSLLPVVLPLAIVGDLDFFIKLHLPPGAYLDDHQGTLNFVPTAVSEGQRGSSSQGREKNRQIMVLTRINLVENVEKSDKTFS